MSTKSEENETIEPGVFMIRIEYDSGTLLVYSEKDINLIANLPDCKWDSRMECFRLPGYRYFHLISYLYRQKIPYEDKAKSYETLSIQWDCPQIPFPYQTEAITAWSKAGKRGTIVLPTGTGKSFVGVMAIVSASKSTIVVVPTIDLMHQWYDVLTSYFEKIKVGLIGGGYFEVEPLTVITYDSSYRHLESLGNRYGMIIFDECHHLPTESYKLGAQFAIAPFRLGLTATPERMDGGEHALVDLIGNCVYRKNITEMSGDYLAEYDVIYLKANLSAEERELYEQNRQIYLNFLRNQAIQFGKTGWHRFIIACSRSIEGRKALLAYLKQKEIVQAAPAKLRILEKLLKKHCKERVLIFTHDNATAYKISRQFLVPVITHQTKAKERQMYLLNFNKGVYSILATSRVLNEGVNVPAANIGIILSGTGSVREHVQRLGRILRKYGEKKALLYEIVTENSAEEYVSKRRREHEAYHRG